MRSRSSMWRWSSVGAWLVASLLQGCGGEIAAPSDDEAAAAIGSGAPSGAHFNLNLIGVSNAKQISGGGGNVIFVPLTGSAKINLSEGTFAVLDKDCTDGSCEFQLPNPDPTNSGTTTYSVFARALGKPGGSSTSTTCATDPVTGETFCSIYSSVQVRTSGKTSFVNVSRELLYVYADVNGDGKVERFNLFDSALQDYYWQYQNDGLKLLQYRFYQVPTTVP